MTCGIKYLICFFLAVIVFFSLFNSLTTLFLFSFFLKCKQRLTLALQPPLQALSQIQQQKLPLTVMHSLSSSNKRLGTNYKLPQNVKQLVLPKHDH